MKPNKIYGIIIILLISSFIIGCRGVGGPRGGIDVQDVRKGYQGLEFEFLENAPSKIVADDSQINIVTKITNNGATDVKQGIMTLTAEPGYLELSYDQNNNLNFDIDGKSAYYPEAQHTIIEFNAITKPLKNIEKYESLIIGTICYDYETKGSYDVCINTDVYGEIYGMKPCTSTDIRVGGGQGAPVAITNIEQKTRQADNMIRPMFLITVENKGPGLVVSKDLVSKTCGSAPIEQKEWNKIELHAKLGEVVLECDDSFMDLKKKKDKVRCIYPESYAIEKKSGNFITNLNILLTYGYTSSESKQVTIEKT